MPLFINGWFRSMSRLVALDIVNYKFRNITSCLLRNFLHASLGKHCWHTRLNWWHFPHRMSRGTSFYLHVRKLLCHCGILVPRATRLNLFPDHVTKKQRALGMRMVIVAGKLVTWYENWTLHKRLGTVVRAQGPEEMCLSLEPRRKPLKKWVILIALKFRYTFYRPQTKRSAYSIKYGKLSIVLLGTSCLGRPSDNSLRSPFGRRSVRQRGYGLRLLISKWRKQSRWKSIWSDKKRRNRLQ